MDIWKNDTVYSPVNDATGITEINHKESVLSGNSGCDEDRTLNMHVIILQIST